MAVDNSASHSGSDSAHITWPLNQAHLALFWQQTVSVTPGKKYHFSGWVKTDGVTTCNGCNYGKGTPTYGFADYDVVFVKPGDANSFTGGRLFADDRRVRLLQLESRDSRLHSAARRHPGSGKRHPVRSWHRLV